MDYHQNPQTSQISSSQYKRSEAKMITWSTFHILGPETLWATRQNCPPAFVHPRLLLKTYTKWRAITYCTDLCGTPKQSYAMFSSDMGLPMHSSKFTYDYARPHFKSEAASSDNHNLAWDVTSSSNYWEKRCDATRISYNDHSSFFRMFTFTGHHKLYINKNHELETYIWA
jgi:hypothetical protein